MNKIINIFVNFIINLFVVPSLKKIMLEETGHVENFLKSDSRNKFEQLCQDRLWSLAKESSHLMSNGKMDLNVFFRIGILVTSMQISSEILNKYDDSRS